MLTELPPLPQCDILDPGRFGVAWQEESVRAYGQACQAATLATVTPLVQRFDQALKLDRHDVEDWPKDSREALNELRAFLSGATKTGSVTEINGINNLGGATKESTDHG